MQIHQKKQPVSPASPRAVPATQPQSGPSMDALRAGTAQPTADMLGHKVDLPGQMQAKMESAFGADLSGVQLYESQAVADAGAQAITQGNRIAFAPGQLDFTSMQGQALLGHELSHVVSQARGEVTGGGFLNDHALEARADREGFLAAQGESVSTGSFAPLSSVSAASAAGPMQAKKPKKNRGSAPAQAAPAAAPAPAPAQSPAALLASLPQAPAQRTLGSDAQLKALYDANGNSTIAAQMDEAYQRDKAAGKEQATMFSSGMQAPGFRSDASAVTRAFRAREGNIFQGLQHDVTRYLFDQEANGVDYAQISRTRSENTKTGVFGGNNFSYSPEISQVSSGMLDVMAPYLETQEGTQFAGEQYDLIKDAQMFSDNPHNGTALDALMGNLFNRQFGISATNPVRMHYGDNGNTDARDGVTAVTSFLMRMPNLVRDVESGQLRQDQIPDHMRPAFDKYITMRDRLGARIGAGGAPQTQAQTPAQTQTSAPAPVQAPAPTQAPAPAPAPTQAPRRDFSGMTYEQLQDMSPADTYDYWTQKFESGQIGESFYRMIVAPFRRYKQE